MANAVNVANVVNVVNLPVKHTEQFTMAQYRELRQKLWLLEDKRAFFLAVIPVETGATPGEIVNIMKDAIRLHRSKEGKTYASVFVHEGCKRVVKKKDKKTQTIVTQARAREIVFNSDLTSKILDFMGYSRASQSQYLIPKLKRSGSKALKGKDTPLSRVGVINILRNCPVRIPYNLHQNKNSKHGGRHLFKQFVRTALIPKKMSDEGMIRVMMGHTPRDSDERYANQVDIELAYLIVENTFVDA